MAGKKKYGISSFNKQFPDEEACLEFIYNVGHTRDCSCGGIYRKIAGRRQFQCSKCRNQVAPTAKTIFNKSETPLVLWFHAILAFFNARGDITAKQLERDLEVTYKCAWRILAIIRGVLGEYIHRNPDKLTYPGVLSAAIKTKYSSKIFPKKKKVRRFR
jgi:transposase